MNIYSLHSSRRCFFRRKIFCLLLSLILLSSPTPVQSIGCTSDKECEKLLRKGSKCWDGSCTNPYAHGGCLKNHLPDEFQKVRTCNSEDTQEIVENDTYCRPSALDYMEIRIASQNWEGAFFVTWILQVLLSELLDVPVSVETSSKFKFVNFYHMYSAMDYGDLSNDFEALEVANAVGDCRKVRNGTSCLHVIPEVWTSGSIAELHEYEQAGLIEAASSLGALGIEGWYIPAFTGARDPTLLHHLGIRGEENRRKLAETFLRPTSWIDYCNDVSESDCNEIDSVAMRAPASEAEAGLYFHDEFYKGHFRKTERNDCDRYPSNCTGHIVDYPCDWTSYNRANTHHLGIALESNGPDSPGATNGYSYSQMTQIWNAANATKSNVIMQWWTPEALYQSFLNTDAELQRVSLPPASQTCIENRVHHDDRCSLEFDKQVGSPLGACDEAPHSLQKVIAERLFELTQGRDIPEALRNPGYDAIKAFSISDLQVSDIFNAWLEKGRDKWNFDPREATCEWIVDNLDYIKSFVPRNHPRVIQKSDSWLTASFFVALLLSVFANILCMYSMYMTFRRQNLPVMRYAQVEFLWLLLGGLMLVSLASLLQIMRPANVSCVLVVWFINFGYTLELVPLMLKVAAVNRLMNAAQRMQKVVLQRKSLFGGVLFISSLVFITLITWTIIDPPHRGSEYLYVGDSAKTSEGETIVTEVHFCVSESQLWSILSLSWQALLLVCATVLAFQTRNVAEEFNETNTLGMMIYSHFVFVILRCITFLIEDALKRSDLEALRSIIFSSDVIGTIIIYFLPKILMSEEDIPRNSSHQTSSRRRMSMQGNRREIDWMVEESGVRPLSRASSRSRNLYEYDSSIKTIENDTTPKSSTG